MNLDIDSIYDELSTDGALLEQCTKSVEKQRGNPSSKANDIIQAADGLPAAIKTLCNYYLKGKEHFESSDWIEVLTDSGKTGFVKK